MQKLAAKEQKAVNKNVKAQAGDTGMQDTDDSKTRGCGQYGGANCTVTGLVNTGAKMGDSIGSAMGSMAVNNAGQQSQQTLAAKGANATAVDFNQAQVDAAKSAQKAEESVMIVDSVAAALQSERLLAHMVGQGAVKNMGVMEKNNLSDELTATEADRATLANNVKISKANQQKFNQYTSMLQAKCSPTLATTANPNGYTDCLKKAKNDAAATVAKVASQNVNDNQASELAYQQAAMTSTMTALVDTAKNIATHAAAMKADSIIAGTTVPTGGGFLFNPSAPGTNPNDVAPAATPDTGAVVANTDNSAAPTNPNDAQFNPGGNPNDGNPAPTPGDLIPGALAGNQNPSTAGGGGVGGTTAAKDDTVAATGKKAADSVGTYTASDGSGSMFSKAGGSGSGPGVGMDMGFAELLKKMLPGGEDEKKAEPAALAFTDRSLASDQAAVIGRNKNIFEEIHKRYQKKNSEGAIVF